MRLCLSLLAILIICTAPCFAADSPAPLKLVGSIPLPDIEGRIDHFSIDLEHQTIFIAVLGANTVLSVDLTHGKVLGSIFGLKEPQGVLYLPENGHLYVANGGGGSVRIYDASTLKQLKSITLGDDADNIRYDAASKTIWIGYGNGAMAALDLDGKKTSDIPVGEHPESFELERRGSKLFVNVPRKKEVAVVDRSAKKVVATYLTGSTVGNYPRPSMRRTVESSLLAERPLVFWYSTLRPEIGLQTWTP
jgi:YVTN family beta-propeller protein